MLREISFYKSDIKYRKKRWFTDSDMDLFVWFRKNLPTRFQLSYIKYGRGHAIHWSSESGFKHSLVDLSQAKAGKHGLPDEYDIDHSVNVPSLARSFLVASAEIEPSLVDFIYARLLEYPGNYTTFSNRHTVATHP